MINFDLTPASRAQLLQHVLPQLEAYYAKTKEKRVYSNWDIPEVKKFAQALSFDQSNEANDVLNHVLKGLADYAVHTPHPSYFGLFNPRTNFASILADLITATFNPQMAGWAHAPFAVEIEDYVIQEFGKKFGYNTASIDGTFCAGGAESNLTAVICALNNAFPNFDETGVSGINQQVAIYCSSESHHSIAKAAKITGLGTQSVRSISVNENLEINIEELKEKIKIDQQNGCLPLMIAGTAGTTGAGAIDDMKGLHQIAKETNMWFHVDAAYGGAVITSKKHRYLMAGIELSDSITLDLHKWFSVPMATSLFLTSNKTILHQSFAIKTNYMPEDGDPNQITDPYLHSIQWSRRFIGLKIFLPLAIYGWEGYAEAIDHQLEMGIQLKRMLQEKGWEIRNNSSLPIVCFSRKGYHEKEMTIITDQANDSGKVWLSVYPINGQETGRACITNYATGMEELNELVDLLESRIISTEVV